MTNIDRLYKQNLENLQHCDNSHELDFLMMQHVLLLKLKWESENQRTENPAPGGYTENS